MTLRHDYTCHTGLVKCNLKKIHYQSLDEGSVMTGYTPAGYQSRINRKKIDILILNLQYMALTYPLIMILIIGGEKTDSKSGLDIMVAAYIKGQKEDFAFCRLTLTLAGKSIYSADEAVTSLILELTSSNPNID
ncbi:hypothetical protein STEG23_021123 [Scotinomys teguina]